MGKGQRAKANKQDKEENSGRRRFLLGSIASILTLAIGTALFSMQKSPLRTVQEEAVSNPAKRQIFLDMFLKGQQIPYCSGVVYDHEGNQLIDYLREEVKKISPEFPESMLEQYKRKYQSGRFDVKTPEVFDIRGKGHPSKIFLGRILFEDRELTPVDFKHIIVAHEGRHAFQHAKGLKYITTEEALSAKRKGELHEPVIYEIDELDANYDSLQRIHSGEFNVSDYRYQDTKKNYNLNLRRLNSLLGSNSPEFQKDLVRKVLQDIGNFQFSR